MKSKSLLIQLAVAITFFISIFEFAIFIGSYRSQKESLKQLRVDSKIKMNSVNMDMNLISNAIDAMENTNERTISISFFTTKEEGKGTGLGLNIVKNIVESHNGTIQLNTNFMSGAEFLISLSLSS